MRGRFACESVRPDTFDGVGDPVAVVAKSAGFGWDIEFSQNGQAAPRQKALTKRGAERRARRFLSEYERWKQRVLSESVTIRLPSSSSAGITRTPQP